MRLAAIFTLLLLVGCTENPQVQSLKESLKRVDSVEAKVAELPLDSIQSVKARLGEAKEEVRWLGADTTVSFIREDAQVINELSKASRWLKDTPKRIKGMASEASRCRSQIQGLISVIEQGATLDAKGDTIDAEYLAENIKREIEAVDNLVKYYEETVEYVNKGLECDKNGWNSVDSLITAKRAMWARGIAGEDSNSEEK